MPFLPPPPVFHDPCCLAFQSIPSSPSLKQLLAARGKDEQGGFFVRLGKNMASLGRTMLCWTHLVSSKIKKTVKVSWCSRPQTVGALDGRWWEQMRLQFSQCKDLLCGGQRWAKVFFKAPSKKGNLVLPNEPQGCFYLKSTVTFCWRQEFEILWLILGLDWLTTLLWHLDSWTFPDLSCAYCFGFELSLKATLLDLWGIEFVCVCVFMYEICYLKNLFPSKICKPFVSMWPKIKQWHCFHWSPAATFQIAWLKEILETKKGM